MTDDKIGGRVCLWCGARANTREHVVPDWLGSVLRGSGSMVHAYVEPGGDDPARQWHAMRPDFTARVVCASCNHGWMSQLEGSAKPRIVRLVGGHDCALSRADCRVLSRWAAKTALMFQACEPDQNRVVPASAFHALKAAGNPGGLPRTMRVWTASVDAHGVWSRALSGTLGSTGGDDPRHFIVLLAIDLVAFMVMGSDDPGALAAVGLRALGHAWTEIGHRETGARWPPTYRFPADQFPAVPELLTRLGRVAQHPARDRGNGRAKEQTGT